ncbi:MAG TPA: hypothetical protein EYG68_00910 [Leucothrix mucor]|nr:hypothetical protein [Leucothrix mucor]
MFIHKLIKHSFFILFLSAFLQASQAQSSLSNEKETITANVILNIVDPSEHSYWHSGFTKRPCP